MENLVADSCNIQHKILIFLKQNSVHNSHFRDLGIKLRQQLNKVSYSQQLFTIVFNLAYWLRNISIFCIYQTYANFSFPVLFLSTQK